jgi:predicted RNase H-like nuclease (RuvC/YqgF family)
MRKWYLGGVAFLFLFQLGVSAPQNSGTAKQSSSASKGSEAKKSLSALSTPQSIGDQIVKFFGRKTGKKLMAKKVKSAAIAGAPAPQTSSLKSPVRTANISGVKPGRVPPPPTPQASVPQIRQEIQKILDLNKKIQSVQSGRSSQFRRVQEQARIHQKILNNLETSQKQISGQKVPTKNALLAQEKLRIIHEETQRNAKMIDELEGMPAQAVSKSSQKTQPPVS